jgi:hypothetical protein
LGFPQLAVKQLHFSSQGRLELGEPMGNVHASVNHGQHDDRAYLRIAGKEVLVDAVERERWVQIRKRLQEVGPLPDSFETRFEIIEVFLGCRLAPLLSGVFEHSGQIGEGTLGEQQVGFGLASHLLAFFSRLRRLPLNWTVRPAIAS